jgi:hypothetical protein
VKRRTCFYSGFRTRVETGSSGANCLIASPKRTRAPVRVYSREFPSLRAERATAPRNRSLPLARSAIALCASFAPFFRGHLPRAACRLKLFAGFLTGKSFSLALRRLRRTAYSRVRCEA